MSEKELFSITGLFSEPEHILQATKAVTKAGYKKFDVHTPYPVHGMDEAMALGESKLGYVTFLFALLGGASILFFMIWTTSIDYPLNIGDKPFLSLPAYIPITFEITVLSAAIFTVLIMIIFFFKLPGINHPLQNTAYLKRVGLDHYGISIQKDDPLFNEEKIRQLLQELGAVEISNIYYSEQPVLSIARIAFAPKFISILILTSVITCWVTYCVLNKVLFLAPFTSMDAQAKLLPEAKTTFFNDKYSMRKPVDGTVARNFQPYMYKDNPELAGKVLTNPLLPTMEVLEKGKIKFNTYCSPCHGYSAKGVDSRLRGQFPIPPTLHSDKVRNWPDGRIYHIISNGQNIMPSYAAQIPREERWAIVLYLRALQQTIKSGETASR